MFSLIAALLVALLAGFLGNKIMGSPVGGLLPTLAFGILGCLVGYFLFAALLGIGDDEAFDLGGLIGAVIGTVLVLFVYKKLKK
ncbi:hypothetical protein B7486_53020 [cyanobacterium TDX16]|nr:hypothetical protein B7486_53020 [cyanobacterium TDX16]